MEYIKKHFTNMPEVVSFIESGLGSEGSFRLANQIYSELRLTDKTIHFDETISEIPFDLWKYAEEKHLI